MAIPNNLSVLTKADLLVFTGHGILDSVIFSEDDAAPTAGTIDIYDGTSTAGKKLLSWTLTTAVFNPVQLFFNYQFNTGLYVKFTTTADVNVVLNFSA